MSTAAAPMPNHEADATTVSSASLETGDRKLETVFPETRNSKLETGVAAAELVPFLVQQDPLAYSAEAHAVWQLLFRRRMQHLESVGSSAFLRGIKAIGLTEDRVPDLAEMNQRLEPITGWRAVAVSGFLEPRLFFQCLAERRFPTTVIVRPMQQLDYLPEPDIFHDVFGHVPMHADPVFADFLQRFGAIAATARNQAEVRMLTRLFWFTVEFGLIREQASLGSKAGSLEVKNDGASPTSASAPRETRNEKPETEVKVYGSGLISSHADCVNALGPDCERRPFVLDEVLAQEFEIDHLQPVLFVIDSHQQLFDAVEEVRERMARGLLASSQPSSAPIRLCAHDHGQPAVQDCQQDLP